MPKMIVIVEFKCQKKEAITHYLLSLVAIYGY